MFKFLKKDNFILGGVMGFIIPLLVWTIIHFINISLRNNVSHRPYLSAFMVEILSLVPNVLLLRYYLITLKADKTGRGILAITFVIAIVLFILNAKELTIDEILRNSR